MSSGGQTREQKFAQYEKDYLQRVYKKNYEQDSIELKDAQDVQKLKDGQNLQNLIFNFDEDVKNPEVTEVTNGDYIGHCTFCMMGVPRAEMAYQKGHLFHSNCFEQQGKNFPAPNDDFVKQNSKTKVELVQLKNLKIRKMGTSNPSSTKPKTKKKSKQKTKKRRPKRRVTKRKRSSAKRKKTKKRTSRRKTTKRRRISKRRTSPKRKRATRKTKRRPSRRAKRRTRRRR